LSSDPMMASKSDPPHPANRVLQRGRRVLRWLLAAGVLVVVVWFAWVYGQIHFYATHDEATMRLRCIASVSLLW
jgi:hypothetical protein